MFLEVMDDLLRHQSIIVSGHQSLDNCAKIPDFLCPDPLQLRFETGRAGTLHFDCFLADPNPEYTMSFWVFGLDVSFGCFSWIVCEMWPGTHSHFRGPGYALLQHSSAAGNSRFLKLSQIKCCFTQLSGSGKSV